MMFLSNQLYYKLELAVQLGGSFFWS